jgi:hypothetical protein
MTRSERVLERVLRGESDVGLPFEAIRRLLRNLGFEERTRGSHYIFVKEGIREILNIQSRRGKAKAYQVRQIRDLIVKYKLGERHP